MLTFLPLYTHNKSSVTVKLTLTSSKSPPLLSLLSNSLKNPVLLSIGLVLGGGVEGTGGGVEGIYRLIG
jgi:hypothetical protein